jgi:hypothetical protein
MNMPFIQSLGPPPERHADRVIAEMMRELARARAHRRHLITETVDRSWDGSPKAQARMAARIRKAGALHVFLEPGKRGRYSLAIFDWMGWDPARDAEITQDDPIPEKPWIASLLIRIDGKGHGRVTVRASRLLFVTHHVLSRAAQRRNVRTVFDMIDAAADIENAGLALLNEKGLEAGHAAPPDGWRTSLKDGGTVVLKKHETHTALVAVTVF